MLAWFGRSGVTFFFVLSGLVLAWTYADAMPRLRVFWWRRFARIWPLHVVATLLSVGVYVLLDRPVSTAGVVAALGLVHAWFNDPAIVNGGNGATWSLSDEAFFYLCFPLLLAVMARARDARRLALLGPGRGDGRAGHGVGPRRGERGHPHDAGLGARLLPADAAAPVRRRGRLRAGAGPRLAAPGAAALGGAGAGGLRRPAAPVARGHPRDLRPGGRTRPRSSSRCRCSCSRCWPPPPATWRARPAGLGSPWLIRLGHWSFAWYLVHEIVIRSLLALGGRPQGLAETAGVWLVALVVSQALAGLLYTLRRAPDRAAAARPRRGRTPGGRPRSPRRPRPRAARRPLSRGGPR